jgi:hypothetical protein
MEANSKLVLVLSAIALLTVGVPSVYAQDLTGVWSCDDGGTYYLHQLGNTLWWLGENDPNSPGFANVARGTINGNIITLNWADVPKGASLNSGYLTLSITSNNMLQKETYSGGFSGSVWTR